MTQTFDEIRSTVKHIIRFTNERIEVTLDAIAYMLFRKELFFMGRDVTDPINLTMDDIQYFASERIDITASNIEETLSEEVQEELYKNWRITAEVLYEIIAETRGEEIAFDKYMREFFMALLHTEKSGKIFQPFSTDLNIAAECTLPFVGMTSFQHCNIAIQLLLKARKRPNYEIVASFEGLCNTEAITSNLSLLSDKVSAIFIPYLPLSSNNEREMKDLLLNLLNQLRDGGRMVCIVPSLVLNSNKWFDLRKTICEKHWLKYYFDMPVGTFYSKTSAKFVVLVFEKKITKPENYIWVAPKLYSHKLSKLSGEYNLDFELLISEVEDEIINGEPRFTNSIKVSYKSIWQDRAIRFIDPFSIHNRTAPEGYKLVPLRTVAEKANEERICRNSSENSTVPVIDEEAFARAKYSFFVNCEELTKKEINSASYKLVKESGLCFDLIHYNCIFCKCNEGDCYYVQRHVIVINSTLEDIPAEYLYNELKCKDFKQALQAYKFGMRVNPVDFLEAKIAIPNIDEPDKFKKKILESLSNAQALAIESLKEQEAGLFEFIDKMKTNYINEIRSRKHDMAPHLRQLSSACHILDFYLSNSDSFKDEELKANMKEQIANQKQAIDSLNTILQIFSREDIFGEPISINIDEYLTNHYFDGPNYTIDHDTDYQALETFGFDIPKSNTCPSDFIKNGKIVFQEDEKDFVNGLDVFIAKDDLQRLFDNIINNAIKHGFTDPNRHDYNITTHLTINSERGMFQIDVRNNGNPLPKGLDKLRYGIKGVKAGPTGGSGEGGHIIKSIVEHYGGDYEIFSFQNSNNTITTVRILLPIHYE